MSKSKLSLLLFVLFSGHVTADHNVIIGLEKPRGSEREKTITKVSVENNENLTLYRYQELKKISETAEVSRPVSVNPPESHSVAVDVDKPGSRHSVAISEQTHDKVKHSVSKTGIEASATLSDAVKRQPKPRTVTANQLELWGTPMQYAMVVKPSSRIFVSTITGDVRFHALSGSLKSNVEALLASTDAATPIVWSVSEQHSNPTDIWIEGPTVLDILDKLLMSYNEPHPIKSRAWSNRVVEIYYDTKNRRGH